MTDFCYYCAPKAMRREIDPSEVCSRCRSRMIREDRVHYLLARYRRLQDHGIKTEADRADFPEAMIIAEALRKMIAGREMNPTEAAALVGHVMLHQSQSMVAGAVGRDEESIRRARSSGIRKLTLRVYGRR